MQNTEATTPSTSQQDYKLMHGHLLSLLGAKDHVDAARIIATHHAREQDAKRYRWLRDSCGIVEYKAAFGSVGPGMLPSGTALDTEIDAAMGSQGGE